DIDKTSITEALVRNEKIRGNKTTKNFDCNFFHADLANEIIETEKIFDLASCFFAIHYFFKDEKSILNFINNLQNLKIGGDFMVTTFCGEKLKEIDYTSTNKRASIIKHNVNPDKNFGNEISVKLSGSVLDEETIEYVVNIDYLKKIFEHNGYVLEDCKLFEEFYDAWRINDNYLSRDEQQFSFLNTSLVFKKVKNIKTATLPKLNEINFEDFENLSIEDTAPKKKPPAPKKKGQAVPPKPRKIVKN